MSPAFSSTRQAAAFGLLLLLILLSPWLAGKSGLPPRDQIYSSISWRIGSFPYMSRQIFEEKGDIDIAFVGSSHLYNDIDTTYVQQQLSKKLGRPAKVLSLCWVYGGYDTLYFIAKELLARRKVHLLVLWDDQPHQLHISSWRWVRLGDDGADLAGLPLGTQISYYYGSILGMPRNLLNRLRPNLAPEASPEQFKWDYAHAWFPPEHLGAFTSQESYTDRPDLFQLFTPKTPATPSDVCLYAPDTRDQFRFSDVPGPFLRAYFAEKFLSVVQDHPTHMVFLNLPIFGERRSATMSEGRLWIGFFSTRAPLMGIVPARLFAGLNDDDVRNLYQDPVHFNQNGQAYFTRLITPKLIEVYEQANP